MGPRLSRTCSETGTFGCRLLEEANVGVDNHVAGQRFSAPVLGILQIQLDPDPTAMALADSEVPEWAEQ